MNLKQKGRQHPLRDVLPAFLLLGSELFCNGPEASSGLRSQAHIQQFPAQVRIGSHQPDGPVGLVIG